MAALGSSKQAQTEFLALVRRWSRASRSERALMSADLRDFRRRYPSDDLGRVADALLAWAALEAGALKAAEQLARQVQTKGAGAAQDIARVVEGAAMRRRGDPEAALAKLLPIVSKVIDSYARALLNEEVVAAALSAKRWAKAVELMDVWLREAEPEERGGVRSRIQEQVRVVPAEELWRILDARLSRKTAEEPGDDELEMRRILARELARVAREKRDVSLAQRLMATSGPLLGDQGDAVAQLAAGSGKPRVEAPTVGLLISVRSDELRRRSVQVAAGVMHGLGLPGSSARIVSRDDAGALSAAEEAMTALSSDGAAIVIAGVDEEEATEAALFAEARRIPVVLLQPPTTPVKASGFVFVLGPKLEEMPAPFLVGPYPVVQRSAQEPQLLAWQKEKRAAPVFWSALGRDAAVLAWQGVAALPAQGTEDPKEVQARRISARDALERATADLWTTEARGFEGSRVAPKRLSYPEVKTAKSKAR